MLRFTLLNPQNNQALIFPVSPEDVQVQTESKTVSLSTLNLGTIEISRGRLPKKITWTAFLPGRSRKLPGVSSSNPNSIVQQIENWMKVPIRAKLLRLIITDTNINIPVFIETFDPKYSGGFGDIFYTITLMEWRELDIKDVNLPAPVRPKPPATTQSTSQRNYTVKSGDTLWGIARKYTGNGIRWTEMWSMNKSRSRSKNPDLIYPGEVFRIPSGW
ncbi:LysM peptidoglycan-binding domain-containing protein [Halalkalibacter sp. AB-rgal2]|uniref:LysM peptidoglycan-binding domain-containing protein n=1 Tax=Halalkalibacter sp. AB-rgal2 TaxID=3242695 RepID=UPI00359E9CF2